MISSLNMQCLWGDQVERIHVLGYRSECSCPDAVDSWTPEECPCCVHTCKGTRHFNNGYCGTCELMYGSKAWVDWLRYICLFVSFSCLPFSVFGPTLVKVLIALSLILSCSFSWWYAIICYKTYRSLHSCAQIDPLYVRGNAANLGDKRIRYFLHDW